MSEMVPQKRSSKRTFRINWEWLGIGAFIGGLLTLVFIQAYTINTLRITAIVLGVTVGLVLIAILAIQSFIEKWLIKEFGGIKPPSEVIQIIEKWIADGINVTVNTVFHNRSTSFRFFVKSFIGGAISMIFLSQFKNRGFRFAFALVASIGAIAGTILLSNQNLLLLEQNKKIDQQIHLEESSRRSVSSPIEISRDIETELKDKNNLNHSLSEELISRIVWQCQVCVPFYYSDNGAVITKPLCPEKGNILRLLLNHKLDTVTLQKIFSRCQFLNADLSSASLFHPYMKEINLNEASFSRVKLYKAKLSRATLRNANLYRAHLTKCFMESIDFQGANLERAILIYNRMNGAYFNNGILHLANLSHTVLIGADFSNSNLMESTFIGADLRRAKFIDADLKGVNFSDANLQNADFSRAKNLSADVLISCYSLYNAKGIPLDIIDDLKKRNDDLFENRPLNNSNFY